MAVERPKTGQRGGFLHGELFYILCHFLLNWNPPKIETLDFPSEQALISPDSSNSCLCGGLQNVSMAIIMLTMERFVQLMH